MEERGECSYKYEQRLDYGYKKEYVWGFCYNGERITNRQESEIKQISLQRGGISAADGARMW